VEEKNKTGKNNIYLIIGIIIIIVSILLGNNLDTFQNTTVPVDNTDTELYDNIGIDKTLLNIIYFDVGQADSTLITINDKVMLIDAGNSTDGYYISEFLKAQNISKIDYLIGTHIDEDHVGGLYKIIEEFDIGTLHMPESTIESKKFYTDLQNTMNSHNIKRTPVEASDTIEYALGDATWKILYIDNSDPQDEDLINDTSIIIELSYKETNYLFMGDCEEKIERTIDWDEINVLKIAHHGSNSSTKEEFLEDTFPDYAVISTNGRYEHPSSQLLERLDAIRGLKLEDEQDLIVYRTDLHDTIWLTSDGTSKENIWIESLDYNLDGANRKVSLLPKIFSYFVT
jgi:competence protein ComEC